MIEEEAGAITIQTLQEHKAMPARLGRSRTDGWACP